MKRFINFVIVITLLVSLNAYAEKPICSTYKDCTPLAENGSAIAQRYLGWLYTYGAKKDKEKAFYWYSKSAEQNDVYAQNSLGNIYLREGDFTNAKIWYERAAKNGLDAAQYELGVMYLKGECGAVDYQKGKELLTKAARQGHKQAEAALEVLESRGDIYAYKETRIADVHRIAQLLEEYKEKAGHYPFYNPAPVREGYVKTGTLIGLASEKAERELSKQPNPFGISAAVGFSGYLEDVMSEKLGLPIDLPYDPEDQAIYAPNAYYIYFSVEDDYIVMAFLRTPTEHTTQLFNAHVNVYAIASSSKIAQSMFWKSAGLKPRIYKDIQEPF